MRRGLGKQCLLLVLMVAMHTSCRYLAYLDLYCTFSGLLHQGDNSGYSNLFGVWGNDDYGGKGGGDK